MSDDPYSAVASGSLKLKSSHKKKKKKSKKEMKEKLERHLREESRNSPLTKVEDSDSEDDKPRDSRTAAQRKYDEVQKQRQLDRVMKKAEKTHKERVEDFNRHLDGLSEHYDIPKVSWTK